ALAAELLGVLVRHVRERDRPLLVRVGKDVDVVAAHDDLLAGYFFVGETREAVRRRAHDERTGGDEHHALARNGRRRRGRDAALLRGRAARLGSRRWIRRPRAARNRCAAERREHGPESCRGRATQSGLRTLVALAQPELFHLELQPLAGDLEEPRCVRDVSPGLLERLHDELALEPAHGSFYLLLEAVTLGRARRD